MITNLLKIASVDLSRLNAVQYATLENLRNDNLPEFAEFCRQMYPAIKTAKGIPFSRIAMCIEEKDVISAEKDIFVTRLNNHYNVYRKRNPELEHLAETLNELNRMGVIVTFDDGKILASKCGFCKEFETVTDVYKFFKTAEDMSNEER